MRKQFRWFAIGRFPDPWLPPHSWAVYLALGVVMIVVRFVRRGRYSRSFSIEVIL
ncbi:MAG: hypothetical protein HYY01_15390 [Chloroflexi bacterium]|nr:hypothetical protein [Chloroflexota bacterium]